MTRYTNHLLTAVLTQATLVPRQLSPVYVPTTHDLEEML